MILSIFGQKISKNLLNLWKNKQSLKNFIAKNRRGVFFVFFARFCRFYLSSYNNDNNFVRETNGEFFILKTLAKYKFSCIFDVGANVGDWSLEANRWFPNAQIHAFEIIPQTAEIFLKNISNQSNIIINKFGLSNENTYIKVNYFLNQNTIATIVEDYHKKDSEVIECLVKNGDSYVQENKIEKIDFIKIDTEGSEDKVLMGLSETLRSAKIDIIQFEYGQINIITKFLLSDFYQFLKNYDYVIGKIYPNYVEFRDYEFWHEKFSGANYLAVRQERTDIINELK